jgi:peptide/nickel transport system substrate-binding protein
MRRTSETRLGFRNVATLVCALAMAACGHGGRTAHALTIADNVDPASLNPLLAHDQDTIGYDLLVTETLIGLSAGNRLVPVLVTRVPTRENGDVSRDGKTIVYHLRPNVRFADGTPFTSADVAFTYRAILDPRNPVESQDAYRRIAALKTPDRHTVVVRLRHRWNAAVAELFAQADFAFGILPAHAFTSTDVTRAAWNQRPFGTGPFRVTQWLRGNRIVLEPNPYYRPRPKLARITFLLIPTTQASLIALRAGDVDLTELNPAQIPQARGIRGVRVTVTPVNGEYMLILQTTAQPTADVRVRRAIAAAIDASEIVRGRFGSLAPADSFLPPVFSWHDPHPAAFRADPAAVARELRAGGWHRIDGWWTKGGKRLEVTVDLQPERGTWMPVVEQEQLRKAGIATDLKSFPASQFNAVDGPMRSGRFTIAATQWIGAADPEQSVIFACSQRGADGNNASSYCNPALDALFEDQATTPNPSRRRRDFVAMQRIVRDGVPIVPIAFEAAVDAVSDRVTGFRRNMLMYPVDPASWDVR